MRTVCVDASQQILLQAHRLKRRGDLDFLRRLKVHALALIMDGHLGGLRRRLYRLRKI